MRTHFAAAITAHLPLLTGVGHFALHESEAIPRRDSVEKGGSNGRRIARRAADSCREIPP